MVTVFDDDLADLTERMEFNTNISQLDTLHSVSESVVATASSSASSSSSSSFSSSDSPLRITFDNNSVSISRTVESTTSTP